MRLFQRAMLPGPSGTIVSPATVIPVYEYLVIRAVDVDAPWARNSIDGELSLWGSGTFAGENGSRIFSGDISVAKLTYRTERMNVVVGRQYVTEGAARFAHLDGILGTYRTRSGFAFSSYGGFSVLPRWNDRANYALLGSAADGMVSRPEDFPRARRSGNWMAGARMGYSHRHLGELGLSVHEQREDAALGRRDMAVDFHFPSSSWFDGSARALLDLDSMDLADGFVGVSLHPTHDFDLAIDYRRLTPTLLMSRQSVLSVFAVDRFDELGGEGQYQVSPSFRVFSGVFVERFGHGGLGTRTRGGIRWSPDVEHRVMVNGSYSRVTETNNGYHSTRLSLGYRVSPPLTLTAEQYQYLYDKAIAQVTTSSVHVVTATYKPILPISILLAGSVFESPYAARDFQAMLRFAYTHGAMMGGEP
jgi:hypothetical protein